MFAIRVESLDKFMRKNQKDVIVFDNPLRYAFFRKIFDFINIFCYNINIKAMK